ncbi:MAG: IS66 family transposase [Candidatus Firestonebacteria bacterium]
MSLITLKNSLDEKSKEELIDEYIELYKKNDNLKKEKEKLERELKKYKNPNTPSSASKYFHDNTNGLKAKIGTRRGAPVGHKGNTIILPEPDKIIHVRAKECSCCHGKNINPTGYVKERKLFRLTIKSIPVQYNLHEYRCEDCSNLTLSSHPDIPENGIYDKNILSLVNYLKFEARIPIKIITDFMNNICSVPMTGTTAYNITVNTGQKLKQKYENLGREIRKEGIVNADETSMSVLGNNNWIWVFSTKLKTFFRFNKERGGKIVEDTLGRDFKGIVVADGWRTYKVYCEDNKIRLQRCWSHGIREVKFECKEKYPELYKWFCNIFSLAKKGSVCKKEKTRQAYYQICRNELKRWVGVANSHQDVRKLAVKIKNGGDNWFTAVLYPEAPFDNNEAERSLRSFVIIRKIIGCLRSERGKETYEIMLSLISTWNKQHKNVFYMLRTLL